MIFQNRSDETGCIGPVLRLTLSSWSTVAFRGTALVRPVRPVGRQRSPRRVNGMALLRVCM